MYIVLIIIIIIIIKVFIDNCANRRAAIYMTKNEKKESKKIHEKND